MAPHVAPRAGRIDVLGVGVDPITVEELHAEIARLVRVGKPGLILNVNAHCLNLSYKDAALRDSLNGADVVFCDGAGVMLAAKMLGWRIPARITYAAWIWRLADFAAAEQHLTDFIATYHAHHAHPFTWRKGVRFYQRLKAKLAASQAPAAALPQAA